MAESGGAAVPAAGSVSTSYKDDECECANTMCYKKQAHAGGPCMRFPNLQLCATCCSLFGRVFSVGAKVGAPCSNRGKRGRPPAQSKGEVIQRLGGLSLLCAQVIPDADKIEPAPDSESVVQTSDVDLPETPQDKDRLRPSKAKIEAIKRAAAAKKKKRGLPAKPTKRKRSSQGKDTDSSSTSATESDVQDDNAVSLDDFFDDRGADPSSGSEDEERNARKKLGDLADKLQPGKKEVSFANPFYKKDSDLLENIRPGKKRRIMGAAPKVMELKEPSKDMTLWSASTLVYLAQILDSAKAFDWWDDRSKAIMTETIECINDHLVSVKSYQRKRVAEDVLSLLLKKKLEIVGKVRSIAVRHVKTVEHQVLMAPLSGFVRSYMEKSKDFAVFPLYPAKKSGDAFRAGVNTPAGEYKAGGGGQRGRAGAGRAAARGNGGRGRGDWGWGWRGRGRGYYPQAPGWF
jgi:hypothetical protein